MSGEDISQITPYIFIGGRYAATGRVHFDGFADYLHRHRIQHVISVLTDSEYADYMIAEEDFADQDTWHRLMVDDEPTEQISRLFSKTTQIIADAVAANEPVLVHCAAGMSRSVTIVAAYLISTHSLTAAEAVAYIKKRRPIADPNRGFMTQLEDYYYSLYN